MGLYWVIGFALVGWCVLLLKRFGVIERSRQVEVEISEQVEPLRDMIAASVADDRLDVPEGTNCLEALRWLDRVSHHITRINLHLQQAVLASGK